MLLTKNGFEFVDSTILHYACPAMCLMDLWFVTKLCTKDFQNLFSILSLQRGKDQGRYSSWAAAFDIFIRISKV